MIIISGKTFEHRDYLKSIGAKWNASGKYWHMLNANTTTLDMLKGLKGVTVTGDTPEKPTSKPDAPEKTNTAFTEIPFNRETSEGTRVYGDDETYLNAFDYKNPKTFFGFSSFKKLIDFVEFDCAHLEHSYEVGRNDGWKITERKCSFTGTRDMREAIEIARNGWSKAIEEAEKFISSLDHDFAKQKRRKHSLAGGHVNIGRMLSGNPVCMTRRTKQKGNQIITLIIEADVLAQIDASMISKRTYCIAAMVILLERAGFRCEVVAHSGAVSEFNKIRPKVEVSIACVLKQATEYLDLNSIVFALGHPSFLRRFLFALAAVNIENKKLWSNAMGWPRVAFKNHPYHIQHLNTAIENKITLDPNNEMEIIFNNITPEDFPVKLKMKE